MKHSIEAGALPYPGHETPGKKPDLGLARTPKAIGEKALAEPRKRIRDGMSFSAIGIEIDKISTDVESFDRQLSDWVEKLNNLEKQIETYNISDNKILGRINVLRDELGPAFSRLGLLKDKLRDAKGWVAEKDRVSLSLADIDEEYEGFNKIRERILHQPISQELGDLFKFLKIKQSLEFNNTLDTFAAGARAGIKQPKIARTNEGVLQTSFETNEPEATGEAEIEARLGALLNGKHSQSEMEVLELIKDEWRNIRKAELAGKESPFLDHLNDDLKASVRQILGISSKESAVFSDVEKDFFARGEKKPTKGDMVAEWEKSREKWLVALEQLNKEFDDAREDFKSPSVAREDRKRFNDLFQVMEKLFSFVEEKAEAGDEDSVNIRFDKLNTEFSSLRGRVEKVIYKPVFKANLAETKKMKAVVPEKHAEVSESWTKSLVKLSKKADGIHLAWNVLFDGVKNESQLTPEIIAAHTKLGDRIGGFIMKIDSMPKEKPGLEMDLYRELHSVEEELNDLKLQIKTRISPVSSFFRKHKKAAAFMAAVGLGFLAGDAGSSYNKAAERQTVSISEKAKNIKPVVSTKKTPQKKAVLATTTVREDPVIRRHGRHARPQDQSATHLQDMALGGMGVSVDEARGAGIGVKELYLSDVDKQINDVIKEALEQMSKNERQGDVEKVISSVIKKLIGNSVRELLGNGPGMAAYEARKAEIAKKIEALVKRMIPEKEINRVLGITNQREKGLATKELARKVSAVVKTALSRDVLTSLNIYEQGGRLIIGPEPGKDFLAQ